MSQENVVVARRAYDHLARTGEFPWEDIDPAVEVHDPPLTPDAKLYRGHQGLAEALSNLEEAFDELRFKAEEFYDAGEDVVVFLRMLGRGKGSGATVDAAVAHVVTVRDEKAIRIRVLDRATALKAAGLQE